MSTTTYSNVVKNNAPKIVVYSGPYGHCHGPRTMKGFDPHAPMSDVKSEVRAIITSMVKEDTGIAGENVSFSPSDATLLGMVNQLGQQPTIMPDPIHSSEVKTLKYKVTTLEDEMKSLKYEVAYLLLAGVPMRCRQLIEKKRERLWETHGSEFTKNFPNSVTNDSYYSREDQRIIIKSLPKHWSQFLDFVKKELRPVPTFWELLHGGEYSDYSNFSKGMWCRTNALSDL